MRSMTSYTIGSLFSGYGGLTMGVQQALGPGRVAWVSDIEPGPVKILAHHHPNTPNLGDITRVDWMQVEPVDVIEGGSPCQDLSLAGLRAGMKPGTRSGLWESMLHAITTIRPRLVVWENVLGALSANAFSLMEPGQGRVGDGPDVPVLRALGRVLGDLAQIGYDAQWETVRASDVGACHQRARVFVVAYPAGDDWWRQGGELADARDAYHVGGHWGAASREGWRLSESADRKALTLPTPRASDGEKGGPNQRGSRGDLTISSAVSLMPTPTATPYGSNRSLGDGATVRPSLDSLARVEQFGDYTDAIRRQEQAFGRPAPAPTVRAKTGSYRLNPRFVEWMMGLPDGHVTAKTIGLTRSQQLRALGNGVVPQQAAHAIRLMMRRGLELEWGTAA